MTRQHGQAGFTLMELMIVVAIIGILGGIAVPAYLTYLEKARIARSIAEIRHIEKSVKLFYVTTERYPLTLAEVSADMIRDPWGTPYQYLNVMTVAAAEPNDRSVLAQNGLDFWSWFVPSSAHATQSSNRGNGNGNGGSGGNGGGGSNSGKGNGQGSAKSNNAQSSSPQSSGQPASEPSGNAGSVPSAGLGPRKDRFGVQLNTDFDLFSMGKNRESADSLATPKSYDDIVRASDGSFVGLASDF